MRLLHATPETLEDKVKLYFAMDTVLEMGRPLTPEEFKKITTIPPLTEQEIKNKEACRNLFIKPTKETYDDLI